MPCPFGSTHRNAGTWQIEARWAGPKQVRGVNGILTGLTDADELTMGWQVSSDRDCGARPRHASHPLG